ncbi:MAG: ABC transporter permease [Beijerinckiaceae bacterium]
MISADIPTDRTKRWPRRRLVGLSILAVMIGLAVLGPLLISADPLRQDLRATLTAPGQGYVLGTDHLGRSMVARLAHAARLSLGFGFITVLAAALPGIALGLTAAWFGGWIDRVLASLCDAVMALPGLLLVLIIAAFSPGAWWPLFLGLALALWVEYFRLVRTIASGRLAAPDVEAARLFGFSGLHVMRRHLLPELWPALTTLMALSFAAVIVAVSTLSFVGVGMRPPTPEWGSMMTELLPFHDEAPLQVLMPAMCLFLTVLGLQLAAGDSDK